MKNTKALSAGALTIVVILSATADFSGEIRFPSPEPLTISVEMGRNDPEPNCRKEVDGCYPKHWVSTHEFESGTPVWMKVTITNRSKMAAIDATGPKDRWIHSLVDQTGKSPELTKEGCWSRNPTCPYPKPDRLIVITAAPPEYWEILPGSSGSILIEVTHEFMLQPPGEYTLSPEIAGFFLTPQTSFYEYGFDEKQAIPIAAAQMKPIKFTVLD